MRKWLLTASCAILVLCCAINQVAHGASEITIRKQFPWVLAYVGKTTNELVADNRFTRLTASVVPDKTVCLLGKQTSLRYVFRKLLTNAPNFVFMKQSEFIVFGGHDAARPDEKVFVWLDWRSNNSAFAIIHHFGPDDPKKFSKDPMLYIGSTSLSAEAGLPASLKSLLKNWIIMENTMPKSMTFNGSPATSELIF